MAHDLRTARALEESIQHWLKNSEAQHPGEAYAGASACALCREFNPRSCLIENKCDGCPVFEFTGERICKATPYEDARRAYYEWNCASDDSEKGREFRAAATNEAIFLISLKEPGK